MKCPYGDERCICPSCANNVDCEAFRDICDECKAVGEGGSYMCACSDYKEVKEDER